MAILLLVVALVTLSGITATASAMIGAAATHSCCDSDNGAPAAPAPCSSPDCSCFSCIALMVYPALTPQRDGGAVPLTLTPQRLHPLSTYVRSIDYPPEQA
ncbi:hypothetical protein GMPD_15020 [Geomonas paludis]|nr:hypothetical protein GMPD_15020 [Geomonas paludis]